MARPHEYSPQTVKNDTRKLETKTEFKYISVQDKTLKEGSASSTLGLLEISKTHWPTMQKDKKPYSHSNETKKYKQWKRRR